MKSSCGPSNPPPRRARASLGAGQSCRTAAIPSLPTIGIVTCWRSTLSQRSGRPCSLRVDPETRIIVGFTVPRFLAAAAPKSMLLFDLLLRPAARLHGITLGELHGIREAMVHGGRRIKSTPLTTDEIARELARLSA